MTVKLRLLAGYGRERAGDGRREVPECGRGCRVGPGVRVEGQLGWFVPAHLSRPVNGIPLVSSDPVPTARALLRTTRHGPGHASAGCFCAVDGGCIARARHMPGSWL